MQCRVCGLNTNCISIYENDLQLDIADEIHKISGVQISKEDSLTKYICENCIELLNACIRFRELCQKTDLILNSPVKTEINDCLKQSDESDGYDDSYNVPLSDFTDSAPTVNCNSCLLNFTDLKLYKKHIAKCKVKIKKEKSIKSDTKTQYLCDTCGKTSTSKASLAVHKSIHQDVFPFKCDVCPYKGRTIDLLKVHKRSHLPEKPYKCTQCPKTTTTASNLTKHMRHVHSTSRPFKCDHCDRMFSYQFDVNRHMRDKHLHQELVECDMCCKKFKTKKILQGHRLKIHKIRSERYGRLPSYILSQMKSQKSEGNAVCDNNYQGLE